MKVLVCILYSIYTDNFKNLSESLPTMKAIRKYIIRKKKKKAFSLSMNHLKLLQSFKTIDGKGKFSIQFSVEGEDFISIFYSDLQLNKVSNSIFFL